MLKATRRYKANGEGCTLLSIKFTIGKHPLISTVVFLMNEKQKVTKTSVEERLRQELRFSGVEFDSYINERLGLDDEDFDELVDKATEKAEELFPKFF